MPGGDQSRNVVERKGEAFGCCPAVSDEGVDGVLPQRGLPPAGVAEQVGLQAAPHASGGVEGVLAVAVLYAAAEPHLGQAVLSQPLVLERLGAGITYVKLGKYVRLQRSTLDAYIAAGRVASDV
jgi:cytochrome c1